MPVIYNSFSPPSSVILAMSSDEESMIEEAVEDIATLEAVEHLAIETTLSRSRHFKHGGTNSSSAGLIY